MTTQAPPSSPHLAAALGLLDELESVTQGLNADVQAKATTANAHAILVLAEQVAAIRVVMVSDAVSGSSNGHPTPQDEDTPKKRRWR